MTTGIGFSGIPARFLLSLFSVLPSVAALLPSQAAGAPGRPPLTERHTIDWSQAGQTMREAAAPRVFRATPLDLPVRLVRLEIPGDGRVEALGIRVVDEGQEGIGTVDGDVSDPRALPAIDPGAPSGTAGGYPYWLLPSGDFHGHRIAHVLVASARDDGDVRRHLRRFEIELTIGAGETEALRRRIDHPRTSSADERLLADLLDTEPRAPAPLSGRVPLPELPPKSVEYVIVTTDLLAPAWQELADIRTREGLPAEVTTVEWIEANYDGNDLPARVRAYVRDAYLYQGLRYLLLGGDTDQIPARIAVSRQIDPAGGHIACDKYYGCLDGNWNADGDHEIGEAPDAGAGIPGDQVDLYAEVSVGRVTTVSVTEVQAYIAKWKSYTGYDPQGFRSDYQTRMLALGEVLFPIAWSYGDDPQTIEIDGAELCESTLDRFPPSFTSTRMYEYFDNPQHPGALPEIKDSVVVRINQGYGFIDHVGHGYRNNMSVGTGKLVNKDADDFTNAGAYPILYAANCTSGAIPFDCIMEHCVANPSGGIIGGVASTDIDYPLTSILFKDEFLRLLFQAGVTTLSDAFHQSELNFVPLAMVGENSFRWSIMTMLAFGDPALEVWTDTPDTLALTFDPGMPLGAGSFTVGVQDDGGPVEGARVTLWKDDGYGVGYTDATGAAVIPFHTDTEGPFVITAVKTTYVPAVDSSAVTAPASAALRVAGWTIHDGVGGGTGNGDGRPDAGESIIADLVVENGGGATATGVQVVLHAPSPFLTVTDSTASSTDIGPGLTSSLTGAFAYTVSASLPDTLRHVVVPATVELQCVQGEWDEESPFSVYQRILDLTALDWTIIDDDGDQILESGETAEIQLTLENAGEAQAVDVVGVATSGGVGFVVLDDTITFGDVDPGTEISQGALRFLSTGGTVLTFSADLTVSDAHSSSLLVRQLDLIRPTAPDTLLVTSAPHRIRLSWARPTATDVRGYRVFRSSSELGPYAEISEGPVDDGSFFGDEGLTPLTTYWYRVASVDSSGNASPLSEPQRASTSPPILDGWPVDLPPGESKGSPTFADLDADQQMEIVLGWSYPMVFRSLGADFVDGDENPQTPGIFAPLMAGLSQFWTSPVVIDLDKDGVFETIFCAWQTALSSPYMFVLDATGAIEPGWPQAIGRQPWSTPAVGDVDGDTDYEIFVASGASGTGAAFQGVLFGFHHNGTEVRDGDANPNTNGVFHKSPLVATAYLYGSPAMADLDADGKDEVVYLEKTSHFQPTASTLYVFNEDGTQLPGFPYGGAGALKASTSSPAIADLDGNGDYEIVAVTSREIVVVNHNGTNFPGWPKTLPQLPSTATDINDFMSSPAIGDVNGDDVLDIALGWLDGKIYLWTGVDGVAFPGFPVDVTNTGTIDDMYLRSPILGNIDGTDDAEILVSSGDGKIYAVKPSGASVPGFPLQVEGTVFGSPALWDVDDNGTVNLIVQSVAPSLVVYDFQNVPFHEWEQPWPMFRHDQEKSGFYHEAVVIGVGPDAPAPAPSAATVYPARPNPFAPRVEVPFDVPSRGERVRIRVFDVGGREVRVLADGSFPGGQYRVSWDGRSAHGERFAPGCYFVRTEIGRQRFVQKVTMLP